MTSPILLIAGREFRTYVATLSFWLSLAIAPLLAGAAVFFSGGPSQPAPVWIQSDDAALARSAGQGLLEAGRLEGRNFAFARGGANLRLSRRATGEWDAIFSDGFPLSPVGRALVAHVMERDAARSLAHDGSQFAVSVAGGKIVRSGVDAAHLSRLVTMTMLWLTLTGSLGMLLQAIVRERANRALESLLAAARAWEIVAGKLLGVGAVSLLVLAAWLGSAAAFSIFLPAQTGLVAVVLMNLAQPLILLRDAMIYVCAFVFYGAATLVLGAMARDGASAQNIVRPLFLLLLAAFFVALAAPANTSSWLVYLPPFTPFLLLVNMPGTVAVMSQAILMGSLLLAATGLMFLAARLLSIAPGPYQIFRPGPERPQPMV